MTDDNTIFYIYKITNKLNDKYYYGKTGGNTMTRWHFDNCKQKVSDNG